MSRQRLSGVLLAALSSLGAGADVAAVVAQLRAALPRRGLRA